MKQRLALLLLGIWIAGTVCVSVVATQNFYTVDRMLAARTNPTFVAATDRLGAPLMRDTLRFLSSELNRLYFRVWNVTQLAIGALTLWLTWGERRSVRWLTAAMWIATAVVALMTPEIVSLGRSLDFVPRDPAPAGLSRFWILHAAYTSLEMIKLALGVVAGILLVQGAPAPLSRDSLAA